MFRQNQDTWQIWARIPVIIISILGNKVLSDFYIGLAQFPRPYVPIFCSFSYKNAGFMSKKITTSEANTKSGNPRKRGEFSCKMSVKSPYYIQRYSLLNMSQNNRKQRKINTKYWFLLDKTRSYTHISYIILKLVLWGIWICNNFK